MKKFEYRVMIVPYNMVHSREHVEELDYCGKYGWELVSVCQEISTSLRDASNYVYHFKREIE